MQKKVVKLLVGMQGSGKTTYCADIEHDNASILHGDDFKTPKEMLKALHVALHHNIQEIVLDRTFGSQASRQPYLDLIDKYPIYCVEYIVFAWQMEPCIRNLCYRSFETDKVGVPLIALQTYVKRYEPPTGKIVNVPMYERPVHGGRRAAFFDESVVISPQFVSAVNYYRSKQYLVFFKGTNEPPPNASDFDQVYLCTHSRGHCLCRKPLPLFAYKADHTYGIALDKSSIVFGDDAFATRVGMKPKQLAGDTARSI